MEANALAQRKRDQRKRKRAQREEEARRKREEEAAVGRTTETVVACRRHVLHRMQPQGGKYGALTSAPHLSQ